MMELLEQELRKSFAFFWDNANRDRNSRAYGLIVDDTSKPEIASIASVGFGLSLIPIGIERGYLTHDKGLEASILTLRTFLDVVPHYKGFFMHFVNLKTGAPKAGCEYSTIDTAFFLNGAMVVDAYFNDPELHDTFMKVYDRVDWKSFCFDRDGKTLFRMAYNPVEGGDYRHKSDNPWIWQWDMFAEQLSMYFLAAASETISKDLALDLYLGFSRKTGHYRQFEYIYSPGNQLFVYQYSHAWVDFKNYLDPQGIDWAENTRQATYANRQWCIDHASSYHLLSDEVWGVTSCLTPEGYRGQGVSPNDSLHHPNGHFSGAIPPSGSLGSLPYAPEIVQSAALHLATHYPGSIGKYGFKDSIALKDGNVWICPDYIGIDKGITALMIDNHQTQMTWNLYMRHPLIKKAITKLGFTEKR
jgi:hypothetical protein